MRACPFGTTRLSSTSGVLPIASSTVGPDMTNKIVPFLR
jgi:hypothetical protein